MSNPGELHEEILKSGTSSETLRLLLSDWKRKGDSKRLLKECLQAVRMHPQDPFLRKLLAEAYAEAGFFSLAEAEMEQVAAKMEELVPVYRLLSDMYRKQHRLEEAIGSLRIYLAHRPQDTEALDIFESLHAPAPLRQAPAAEAAQPAADEAPQAAAEVRPELRDEAAFEEIATPTLAEVYFNQGEIAEALTIYRKVLARNPQDEKARQRYEELQSMTAPAEPEAPEKEADWARRKKERAIAILEAWLTDLRRLYRGSVTT